MNKNRIIGTAALLACAMACSAAVTKKSPGEALFSDASIPQFEIQIVPDEWEKLRRDNRTYVRATVNVGTNTFRDVAVRLKGHGSFRPLDDKPSLALNFDEFKAGQKLDGLTKVLLNNASQDTSLLSEYIAAGMFRDAGVPAARVTHARIQLNARDLGFYVLAEAMNKVFLKQHFGDSSGPLYSVNARDINYRLEQSNGVPTDQSDVALLVIAARQPQDQRAKALAEVLDTERFLSFLAISVLGAQHDSYPLNRNNYRLYRDSVSRRFVMMPHGIDGSFSRIGMPITLASNYVLTRAIVDTPELQKAYRERVAVLFTNAFKLDVLTDRIHGASLRLQSAAPNETERASIAARANGFAKRVAERHRNVADQLAGIFVSPVVLNPGATLLLTNWNSEVNRGPAAFDQVSIDGKRSLHIRTGDGDSLSSWRRRILLAPGSYRFHTNVRLVNSAVNQEGTNGAALRISGRPVAMRAPANGEWTSFQFAFVVREGEEDVQFVCECRGPNLEAWFDLDSLLVRRE